MKILAIKFRALGDTVLWTPALNGLRKMYPGARIDVMALESSRSLLSPHPSVDRFIGVAQRDGWPLLKALLLARKEKYDLALAFHANTSLCRWLFLAGAKEKIAHHHSWKYTPSCSDRQLERPGVLLDAITRDFEILKALGWQGDPPSTSLQVTAIEQTAADKRLEHAGLAGLKPRLLLLPGASEELKRYPRDLWEKLIPELKASNRFELALVADPELSTKWGMAEWAKTQGVPLFENLKLREFMALISKCQAAICSDSGPGHIAVACGLKTIHIFGRGCVGDFHPYNTSLHKTLREVVDCRLQGPQDLEAFRFCTVKECSHLSCLRKIAPEKVAQTALSFM